MNSPDRKQEFAKIRQVIANSVGEPDTGTKWLDYPRLSPQALAWLKRPLDKPSTRNKP